jgi:hypothetical protein
MRKFGVFLGSKMAVPDNALEPAPPTAMPAKKAPPDNPLELDEELFSAIGAQIGGENEALRTLLLNANAKVGELDMIKDVVGKLVDPMSRALRAIKGKRSEKAALQTVLNNTRTAYGTLRNESAESEKKRAASLQHCNELRQDLANTQNLLRTAEATRAEIAIDIAARKSPIWKRSSRTRPARAKCCAGRTTASTNGSPPPISASSRSNPISIARANAY